MLEQRTAKTAEAKPKGKAEAGPRAKAAMTRGGSRTAAAKPAAAQRRTNDIHERIQRRAYELWEDEGRPAGREHANWLQAESEVARARNQRVGAQR